MEKMRYRLAEPRVPGVSVRDKLVADIQKQRKEAVRALSIARDRGHADVAQGYERLIVEWDELLGRYGVEPDA